MRQNLDIEIKFKINYLTECNLTDKSLQTNYEETAYFLPLNPHEFNQLCLEMMEG